MLKTNRSFLAGAIAIQIVLGLALGGDSVLQTEDVSWPRQIDAPQATVIVYQPQIETYGGHELTARAAVSVTRQGPHCRIVPGSQAVVNPVATALSRIPLD